MAVLNTARAASVVLKLCGDEVRVTAFAPDPALIAALRHHKANIAILCRASADLGVRLTWCAAQLCIDDDPVDLGYAAMRHFLQQRLERWDDVDDTSRVGPYSITKSRQLMTHTKERSSDQDPERMGLTFKPAFKHFEGAQI
jgi:hypothetical protein